MIIERVITPLQGLFDMEEVWWRGHWTCLIYDSLSGNLKSVDNPRPNGATYIKIGQSPIEPVSHPIRRSPEGAR